MASVRGPDPCLAAGSDPDCVTTNRVRDTTYVGTGLCWLPWPKNTIKRKKGQYWDREKIGQHQKKDTLEPKKVRIAFALLLLLLLFSLHLFFYDFKGIKTKEKTKIKKNQSPDPAILGRIRTRDPDPDHFGPDFDSGSGCGSAFTDLQSGSPQKHGLVLLILHFLNGLF